MKYKTEGDVMKALQIESWDSVDQDSMLKFGSLLPQMNAEVAQKLIEQFPNFKDLALGVLDNAEAAYKTTVDSNDKSQDQVFEAWRETRQILKGELKSNELTWEQRKYILDLLYQMANDASAKDSESKEFLKNLLGTAAKISLGALAAALVFVGAKALDGKLPK